MKLSAELDADDYALVEKGEALDLTGEVTVIEIRQQEGLLSHEREVRHVERLGVHVAHRYGVGGDSPVIRVWMRAKEDSDGDED